MIEPVASENLFMAFASAAMMGSTWAGYFAAQNHSWFIQGMEWRTVLGVVTTVGFILLIWDLLTIGKGETRKAEAMQIT